MILTVLLVCISSAIPASDGDSDEDGGVDPPGIVVDDFDPRMSRKLQDRLDESRKGMHTTLSIIMIHKSISLMSLYAIDLWFEKFLFGNLLQNKRKQQRINKLANHSYSKPFRSVYTTNYNSAFTIIGRMSEPKCYQTLQS